jgi:hypothetical protein
MKTAEVGTRDKVDELLDVLDKDIGNMQRDLSCLNELRGLVIKRDDAALNKLLERIQSETNNYKDQQLRRRAARKDLADMFDCDFEQVTLSNLEARLPEGKRDQVAARKAKLKELVKELKKEHISTALLLSECARFNSLLLKSILGLGRSKAVTYTNNGAAKRQNDTAFVNMRF